MLDKSPVLVLKNDHYVEKKAPSLLYFFCGKLLRKVFELPADAKKIQLKAYARPGEWRVKVALDALGSIVANGKWYLLSPDVKEHAKKLLQDRDCFYVECEYEN